MKARYETTDVIDRSAAVQRRVSFQCPLSLTRDPSSAVCELPTGRPIGNFPSTVHTPSMDQQLQDLAWRTSVKALATTTTRTLIARAVDDRSGWIEAEYSAG